VLALAGVIFHMDAGNPYPFGSDIHKAVLAERLVELRNLVALGESG